MKNKGILIFIILLMTSASAWFLFNKYRVVIPPVDVAKSEIGWSGKSVSGAHTGKIGLKKAELRFQNDKLVGGMFEADMKAITVTDISDPEENKGLKDHLENEDFFAAEKYPTASFRITESASSGDGLYRVKGIMKIKEKEQELAFDVKVFPIGKTGRRATATVPFDRTLFGIEYAAKDKPGSEKDWFIYNEILLNINIISGN